MRSNPHFIVMNGIVPIQAPSASEHKRMDCLEPSHKDLWKLFLGEKVMWLQFSVFSDHGITISSVTCSWGRNITLTASWESDGFLDDNSVQDWDYWKVAGGVSLTVK